MSLTVFTSDEFGELRAVATNDTPGVIASDVARILGYPEANKLRGYLTMTKRGARKWRPLAECRR